MHRLASTIAAVALATTASQCVIGLPDDRIQAIEITANQAVRDERAGFTVYSGNVILDQGSLHIEAERLTIYHDREDADRIVAEGDPARMRQHPEQDKDPVTAEAGRIEYFKSLERVVLRQAATIEQGGAIVTGESIVYFMAEQRVRANASEDDSDRVQVVIPAEVIREQSGAAADESEGGEPDGDSRGP
jgi:lipopolysaccharide export system protein LptA